ncbi:MAG: hypothetical protein RLN72_01815 [Henriciella sp.]
MPELLFPSLWAFSQTLANNSLTDVMARHCDEMRPGGLAGIDFP